MKKIFTNYGGRCHDAYHRVKLKKLLQLCLAGFLFLLLATPAIAQTSSIKGVVLDETKLPLPGVTVKLKGTTEGTVTNIDGQFSINASIGQTLVFSFLGYASQEVTIKDLKVITVNLAASSTRMNEVVVVGYGTQKKVSLTGSIATVSNQEIVATKNENVENMLTGKAAGLRVVQNSSEPGNFDNFIDIRGFGGNPLVVIDGIPRDNITRLDPNDVESVSVLKDASAAVYGVRAANGVILVTTKKGKKGSLEINYSGTYGWQVPSGLPKAVGAVDFMTLANELSMHNVNGGHLSYTDEQIQAYANGSKTSTDWYSPVVRKSAPQVQHNLSVTGGNENTNYFLSAGYTGQDGIFQSGDLNYKRYNVRSNISSRIGKNLTVNLNLSGTMDQKNQPYQDAWWIIRSFWRQVPTQSIYANNNPAYLNNGQVDGSNPVAMADADIDGYKIFNNKWFQSSIDLTYKIPGVDGLSIKGLYNYDYQMADNKIYQKAYNQYNYDANSNTYSAISNQSPSTIRREFYEYPTDLQQLSINYNHTFNKVHNVTALLLYEQSSRNADNFFAQRELSLPVDQLIAGNSLNQQGFMDGNGTSDFYKNTNKAYVGRLTYDYKSKYLAEFSFRDDGSSQFTLNKQWGFFPAGSIGWRVSEEDFWKNSSLGKIVDNLKFRASYGVTGDDSSLGYQFLTGYTYPAGGGNNTLPGGSVFDGTFVNAVNDKGLPNPLITWSTSKTFDVGVDAELMNGLFGFSFDYFRRNRTGLLATEILSLPDVVGTSLPQENLNSDRTRGIDLEITHRNNIGAFNYSVKGTMGLTRTMNVTVVQSKAGNSYLDWRNNQNNRNTGTYWGQGAAGRFTSYGDIINSPTFVGRGALVGDYAYQDYNGDGVIDDNDVHPVAYTGAPLLTYGITLSGNYKGFDFNALFQGTGMVDVSYFEQLNTPLWGGGSALSQFLDRYHPVDPKADPYDPKTVWTPGNFAYTGSVPDQNSMFNIQSAAYLRLKSAEIGYTIPNKILSRIGVKGIRVFANGYNIATWTKLKYLDPEHPSSTYGYLYPLDKIFSFGVNVKL